MSHRAIITIPIISIMASCGQQPQIDPGNSTSDTIALPSELLTDEQPKPSTVKHAHNAQNFFAIEADGKVMVGNSADILKTTDIAGTDIALSPDGYSIAYTDTSGQHKQVHIYDIATQQDQQLSLGGYDYYARNFSPDGNFLAVNCQFDELTSTILIYDLRDSTMSGVANPEAQSLYNPTFSPDGELMVCHDMRKVFVYKFENGIAKHTKTISCDNLCIDNDLSINTDCRLQFISTHDQIVYTCADYGTMRKNLRHLNIYDIRTGKIHKILSDSLSCKDFSISDDGNIYFLMENNRLTSVACLASIANPSPVAISQKKFRKATALKVAY